MIKVAVTGSEGFLGTAILKKLDKEKITYTPFNLKKNNLFKISTLRKFLTGVDVVIHLAAINRGQDSEMVKVNCLGTQSLLEAMNKYCPNARIIFASSFQVYLKKGLYSLTKKMAEDLIKEYSRKTNLKGTIFRISNIYGPGGKPFYNSVIATFVHLIKQNQSIQINGDGSSKRDFIYVDDVADAFSKAILYQPQKNFEIFDICSAKEVTLNQILNILKVISRKKVEIMYNKSVKEKPWPTSSKNFKIAKKLFDWGPTTTLEIGLKNTINR